MLHFQLVDRKSTSRTRRRALRSPWTNSTTCLSALSSVSIPGSWHGQRLCKSCSSVVTATPLDLELEKTDMQMFPSAAAITWTSAGCPSPNQRCWCVTKKSPSWCQPSTVVRTSFPVNLNVTQDIEKILIQDVKLMTLLVSPQISTPSSPATVSKPAWAAVRMSALRSQYSYIHCRSAFFTVPSFSPSEKGVIEIIKSNYGRLDRNNCTDHPSNMTFCTSEDFGPVVSNTCVYVNDQTCLRPERQDSFSTPLTLFSVRRCEGLESCTVPVDPNSLPPPEYCDDFPKYAYISYICKEWWALPGCSGAFALKMGFFSCLSKSNIVLK